MSTLAGFYDPYPPHIHLAMEAMRRQMQSMSGIADAIEQAQRQSALTSKALLDAFQASKAIQETLSSSRAIGEMLNKQEQALKRIGKMFGSLEHVLASTNLPVPTTFLFSDQLKRSLEQLKQASTLAITQAISDAKTDGLVASDNTVLTEQEANDMINDYFEEVAAETSGSQNVEQVINSYIGLAAKQHPIIYKILLKIVLPIFIALIAVQSTSAINIELNIQGPSTIYEIQHNPMRKTERAMLNELNLKIVTADNLFVRTGPSRKNKIIGSLKHNEVVTVLATKKKRDWAFVERPANDNTSLRGWVYTSYIRPF